MTSAVEPEAGLPPVLKWIGLPVSLALVAALYLFLDLRLDQSGLADRLVAMSPASVVAAVGLLWLNFAVSTERYRLVLQNLVSPAPRYFELLRLTLFSLCAAHVAVGPAADLVRIGYSRVAMGLSVLAALESVIYDRLLVLVGLAAFGLLLLPLQAVLGVPANLLLAQAILWLLCLCTLAAFMLGASADFLQRYALLRRAARSVSGFVPAMTGRGAGLAQAALAAAYCGTYGLAMWVLARGLGFDPGALLVIAFSPIILLAQNLPVFYVGWGGREAAVIGTLGLSGALSFEHALALSVATGIAILLASLPGAVLWLWPLRRSPAGRAESSARPKNGGSS